jgi:tetratricopeptide (TPR) repeat protein
MTAFKFVNMDQGPAEPVGPKQKRLINALLARKDLDQAKEELEKALSLGPDDDVRIKKALWCSAVMSYGRVFTSGQTQFGGLVNDMNAEQKETHGHIMEMRNTLFGHNDGSDFVLAKLERVIKDGKITDFHGVVNEVSELYHDDYRTLLAQVEFLRIQIEMVIGKAVPAALEEANNEGRA